MTDRNFRARPRRVMSFEEKVKKIIRSRERVARAVRKRKGNKLKEAK
jgi:hypothetical protein